MPERVTARRARKRRPDGNPVVRTAQLARKREQRGRSIRIFAVVAILLAIGLAAGYQFWLRDSSLVEIRDLTIRGLDPKDEEGKPITEAVRVAVGEMTTLHPKPDLLTEELARFPRVAASSVDPSFPNGATVTLTIRRDGSRMGSGAGEKLIATDGTVLGPAGDRASGLPSIAGGNPPAEGRLEGRDLAQALVLGGAPEPLRPYVESSRFGPDGVEVTVSNGMVLGFGAPVEIGEKWKAAAAVIADPEVTGAVYVDLGVPGRPATRETESVTGAEEPATTEGSEVPEAG